MGTNQSLVLPFLHVRNSLQGRLLVVATLVLAAFLTLTGIALDRAYRQSIRVGIQAQLQGQLFGLMASADMDVNDLFFMPNALSEARFSQFESGLYGRVLDGDGESLWTSISAAGVDLPALKARGVGQTIFDAAGSDASTAFFVLSTGVGWELESGERAYTFIVFESDDRYRQQVAGFRNTLFLWLGGAAAILLLVQALILRWGLRPVRRAADEIAQIEQGERDHLGDDYPHELRGLTANINTFISNEKKMLTRYRNTLGDLAHSLKTPLTVIRGMADDRREISEQVDRMTSIVDYQLRRASSSSDSMLQGAIAVKSVLTKMLDSLHKVYASKDMQVSVDGFSDLQFFGEEGDLYEILGNVLDNAFKYGRSRIDIVGLQLVDESADKNESRQGLRITVGDDGEGIDGADRQAVLERGRRVTDAASGQGIGLSVVNDLVSSYGGRVIVEESALGGAKIVLNLPRVIA